MLPVHLLISVALFLMSKTQSQSCVKTLHMRYASTFLNMMIIKRLINKFFKQILKRFIMSKKTKKMIVEIIKVVISAIIGYFSNGVI